MIMDLHGLSVMLTSGSLSDNSYKSSITESSRCEDNDKLSMNLTCSGNYRLYLIINDFVLGGFSLTFPSYQ
jgi:hypothetical protein